jgi:hypothetical protein
MTSLYNIPGIRTSVMSFIVVTLFILSANPFALAAIPAGYSEYYIPGDEDQLWAIFEDLDNDPDLDEADGIHCVIAVTAYTDATTIYYDHWEVGGYNFDPGTPSTADETYTLNKGEMQRFESSNIPIPRGTSTHLYCRRSGGSYPVKLAGIHRYRLCPGMGNSPDETLYAQLRNSSG